MPRVSRPAGRRPALAVLAGGLIVGTLDILYACLFWKLKARVPARRIFQSVAAGLLGRASFEGGTRTAALGLGLHFSNATTMSVVYYLMTGRFPWLLRRPWLAGAGYGLLVYGVMNHVVVPLSAAKQGAKDPWWIRLSLVVHIFFVGIPIAIAAARARRAPAL
jgi:hypothetical protein